MLPSDFCSYRVSYVFSILVRSYSMFLKTSLSFFPTFFLLLLSLLSLLFLSFSWSFHQPTQSSINYMPNLVCNTVKASKGFMSLHLLPPLPFTTLLTFLHLNNNLVYNLLMLCQEGKHMYFNVHGTCLNTPTHVIIRATQVISQKYLVHLPPSCRWENITQIS